MSDENGGKKFVNCFDGYSNPMYSVLVGDGITPKKLAEDILEKRREVHTYTITNEPKGAIVKY